jgi:hypothetical protein
MKKTALTLIVILALLVSTMAGAKLVNWAVANPYPYTNCDSSFVTVSIFMPENKTYDANSILVTIFAGAFPGVMGVGYSVDGGPITELAPEKWNGHTFNQSVFLNGLSKGSHNIVAKAITWKAPNDILTDYSQVYFTVTKTLEPQSPSPSPTATNYFVPAPILEITYPLNTTYSGELAQAIPLRIDAIVLAESPAVISISYSLDGSTNITFTDLGKTGEFPSESGRAVAYHVGQASLNNLANGTHTLKAYSRDVNSNEMSDSVEFTVSGGLTPASTGTPFSLIDAISASNILLALLCLVVVVTIALVSFAYLKNRNKEAAKKKSKFTLYLPFLPKLFA